MRILIATPRSPLRQGGVERHVLEVARRFSAAGADVEVICGEPGAARAEAIEHDGVLIHSLPAYPSARDWYFTPSIWRRIAPSRWDILHVQSYHTFVAPLAMLRALRLRLPYVLTFHGGGHSSQLRNRGRPLQLTALRPLLARAERLVAVARFEIDEYARALRLPRERFVLIPNGVELAPAPEIATGAFAGPPSVGGSTSSPAVASIGRLERYKGHHRVIAAFPHVLAAQPDARLLIVGSGPYEHELWKLSDSLRLGPSIQFTSVPAGDAAGMAELLSRVSLVVLMSEYETHPLVGLEAAAAGKRLLVADRGGLLELAADGLARTVSLDSSPATLGDAILRELSMPPPTTRPDLISWDQCAERLLELYRQITAAAGSG